MFYIQQTHANGCGYACLKMVLANLRHDKRWLYLSEDEKIMSYKDVIFEGNKYGLDLCAFQAIEKREIEKHKTFPMIVSLVSETGGLHAVVVTKIKSGKVSLLDPAVGETKMKLLDFVKVWDGTGLLIESDNGASYPYESIEKNNKGFVVSLAILQALSLVSCALGIYFIDSVYPIAISIICLSLFIVLEILIKSFLLNSMKKTDDRFIENKKIKIGQKKEFFIRLQEYKKHSSLNIVNLISEIIISAFVCVLLLINNYWNFIIVAMPFALAIFNIFFTKQKTEKDEKNVAILESQINEEMDDESFKKKVRTINEKAYKVGTNYLSSRYINILCMLIAALLVVSIEKQFTLTLSLFYVVSQIVLFEQFQRIFTYSKDKRKSDLSKAKLYNTIHLSDENN